jgi:hypothetical protein
MAHHHEHATSLIDHHNPVDCASLEAKNLSGFKPDQKMEELTTRVNILECKRAKLADALGESSLGKLAPFSEKENWAAAISEIKKPVIAPTKHSAKEIIQAKVLGKAQVDLRVKATMHRKQLDKLVNLVKDKIKFTPNHTKVKFGVNETREQIRDVDNQYNTLLDAVTKENSMGDFLILSTGVQICHKRIASSFLF